MDEIYSEEIAAIHAKSRQRYGSPRVHAELVARGAHVGKKRVERLMRESGLQGRRRRSFRKTTDSNHSLPIAPNLLERDFVVEAPDKVWVADIKAVRTTDGWLYLAVVLDLFSRLVIGWSMLSSMRTELCVQALMMALGRRRPSGRLVHHSDRGSQYASADYRNLLLANGMTQSMSRKGDCFDNAVAESFYATLETELLQDAPLATFEATKSAIYEFIEVFYNRQRRHSYLNYQTPVEFENLAADHLGEAA
jgi:transposase InsO family protein